jgi:hypothetical protein
VFAELEVSCKLHTAEREIGRPLLMEAEYLLTRSLFAKRPTGRNRVQDSRRDRRGCRWQQPTATWRTMWSTRACRVIQRVSSTTETDAG